MYCSKCGKNNEDYALYCANDGYDLQRSSNAICLKPIEAGYCSACGAAMARHTAYCSACGEEAGSHVEVQPSVTTFFKPANAVSSRPAISPLGINFKTYLKKGMLGGFAAIVALLLLCMIISIALNKQIPELMSEDNPVIEILNQYEVDSDFKIFGIPETAMAVNLISSSMHITGGDGLSGAPEFNIHVGLITLLLVPLTALIFGGYLSARFYRLSGIRESLMVSMAIGLYYGGGLLIISRLAGFTKQIGMDMDMYYFDQLPKLIYSFSWVEALLIGWLLGTCFSWMGYKLYTLIHTDKKRLLKESAVAQAIRAVVISVAALSLLAFVFVVMKIGHQVPFTAVLFVAPQLGLYLFNLAHLGSLRFGGEEEKVQYSLFSGVHVSGEEIGLYGSSQTFDFLDGYVYCGLFVAFVILMWVGYRYVRSLRQSTNIFSSIGIFSVTYGAVMAVLSKLSSIGITMAGGGQAEDRWMMDTFFADFHMGYIFLSGFIISLVLLLVGSFISQKLH